MMVVDARVRRDAVVTDEYTVYFHCFSGVSGDMIIGSLLDTGLVDLSYLENELKKIGITGYRVEVDKTTRCGISGTKFTVIDEGVEQRLRTLPDISKLIEDSELSSWVKEKASAIFTGLARAEAKVHDIPSDEVHFHEIGAVDTLVDVVGTLILLEKIGIEKTAASRINTGRGTVKCAHGTLPVPAPATLELLKEIPIYSTGIESELTTPTGAAIVSTLSSSFGDMPSGEVISIGYGAGSRELEQPNLLRAVVIREDKTCKQEKIVSLETNIDDMNPELYTYIFDELFEAGALDVSLTPLQMKKNRPGTKLSVLCDRAQVDPLIDIILKETSTFGVRIIEGRRYCLERGSVDVKTRYGTVRVKIGFKNGEPITFSPEYEDCAKLAKDSRIPLKNIYREAKRLVEEQYGI